MSSTFATPTSVSRTGMVALLAACVAVLPAMAQSGDRDQHRDQHRQGDRDPRGQAEQSDRERDDRGRRDRSERQHQADDQRRAADRRGWSLRPEGWVTIAVDTDGDRRFDSTETIYYYDLQRARSSSAQRKSDRQGMSDRQRRSDQQQGTAEARERGPSERAKAGDDRAPRRDSRYRSDRPRSESAQRESAQERRDEGRTRRQHETRTLSGRITNLKTFRLSDGPEHRLAKLETSDGRTVPVDLGRVGELERLDLRDGDEITVTGKRARIDDRKMFHARVIRVGDQSIRIGRERDRGLKRVQGEIAGLRTTRLRDFDQEFQVARVDLMGGRTEQVILGPKPKLGPLDLRPGDRVQMLVRRGRYNDQPALIADQIRANGETAQVSKPSDRRVRSRQQSGS